MRATILNYTERFFDGVKALWVEAFPDPPPWADTMGTAVGACRRILPLLGLCRRGSNQHGQTYRTICVKLV